MKGPSILLLVCLVLAVVVEGKGKERRPQISPTFHAKVSVVMAEGGAPNGNSPWWKGGGIYAVDMENGIARKDMRLEGQGKDQKTIHFHTLQRFDMHTSYTIDELQQSERRCTKQDENGKMEHPFGWVEKAEYKGKTTYMGSTLENWELFDNMTSTTMKIAVIKGTNIPLFFSTRQVKQGTVTEWDMTFSQFNPEPMPKWMTYIPQSCIYSGKGGAPADLGDNAGAVYFANKNWDCADPACSQTVPAGTGQPNYACAEFVARSLVYGGFIPGIGAYDDQSGYYDYSYNGNGYDLCLTTGLSGAVGALGFASLSADASSVSAACAVFGDGGDGDWSHAVIGVGPQTVDAHNNARYQIGVTNDLINGIDAVQCPSGSGSSGTSSGPGSSSSGSSYSGSATDVEDVSAEGGNGVYDITSPASEKVATMMKTEGAPSVMDLEVNEAPVGKDTDLRVREEKAANKF